MAEIITRVNVRSTLLSLGIGETIILPLERLATIKWYVTTLKTSGRLYKSHRLKKGVKVTRYE